MLEINQLSFQYGKNQILNNISFKIIAGTMIAVLGPNGSGKTTLLRCIASFLKPQSGTILLHGKKIESLSAEKRAKRIAYMSQHTEVSGLTVFDAVLLGRKPYTNWKPTTEDLEKVEQILQRLNLADKILRPIDRLSGGEMQKVSLARILVQEAGLLLLDEPTSALDLKNRVEILSLLREFVHERQLIGLLSIHDLNDALRFTDRLLLLKNGNVFADEKPETLTNTIVESVYGLPVELHQTTTSKFIIPH
ncbi:MAG: ABC transporter ATP-binding protein [Planctomycetaceae bacterium]|jgi:iron complex transport system ATP-binding protein|nr:ABC transporter ATP-binding protein [Planctomycetaceae bacterium]